MKFSVIRTWIYEWFFRYFWKLKFGLEKLCIWGKSGFFWIYNGNIFMGLVSGLLLKLYKNGIESGSFENWTGNVENSWSYLQHFLDFQVFRIPALSSRLKKLILGKSGNILYRISWNWCLKTAEIWKLPKKIKQFREFYQFSQYNSHK